MVESAKKVTVIAEACQNHNGDRAVLKEMIYAAKEAGADIIKIQSMLAADLTRRPQFETGIKDGDKIKAIQRPFKPEVERLKPMDLDDEAHRWFVAECQKAGIKPMTTIFSWSRLKFLSSLPWDSIKLASYDCASFPLIVEVKKYFKHLYISTGATYDDEIKQAAQILRGHSYSLLHCVTIYPTPLDQIHLKRMDWLRQFTPSVGFSDHTLASRDGLKASKAAIFYGADVIERHFTVLRPEQSKDGPVSINPAQLKELVQFASLSKSDQKKFIEENVPEYAGMIGSAHRDLSDTEKLNRDYYRGRFAMRNGDKYIYNWETV